MSFGAQNDAVRAVSTNHNSRCWAAWGNNDVKLPTQLLVTSPGSEQPSWGQSGRRPQGPAPLSDTL